MPVLGLRFLLASCKGGVRCQHRRDNDSLSEGLMQSSRDGVRQVVDDEPVW